jgi:hypothetical protein
MLLIIPINPSPPVRTEPIEVNEPIVPSNATYPTPFDIFSNSIYTYIRTKKTISKNGDYYEKVINSFPDIIQLHYAARNA